VGTANQLLGTADQLLRTTAVRITDLLMKGTGQLMRMADFLTVLPVQGHEGWVNLAGPSLLTLQGLTCK
jgi:hypothetical protein